MERGDVFHEGGLVADECCIGVHLETNRLSVPFFTRIWCTASCPREWISWLVSGKVHDRAFLKSGSIHVSTNLVFV